MSVTNNIEPICKYSDLVNPKKVNGNLWVASDKNRTHESLIYADTSMANSDRVRSSFAKRTGVKFTDVRCSRLKNFK